MSEIASMHTHEQGVDYAQNLTEFIRAVETARHLESVDDAYDETESDAIIEDDEDVEDKVEGEAE